MKTSYGPLQCYEELRTEDVVSEMPDFRIWRQVVSRSSYLSMEAAQVLVVAGVIATGALGVHLQRADIPVILRILICHARSSDIMGGGQGGRTQASIAEAGGVRNLRRRQSLRGSLGVVICSAVICSAVHLAAKISPSPSPASSSTAATLSRTAACRLATASTARTSCGSGGGRRRTTYERPAASERPGLLGWLGLLEWPGLEWP